MVTEGESKKLIVISVPFARTARYMISSALFSRLKVEYDVLLVGPLFASESVRAQFSGDRVRFWAFDQTADRMPWLYRRIFIATEMLRRYGHWFRFRKLGLAYYWDCLTRQTIAGAGTAVGRIRRWLLYRGLGVLGYFRSTWSIVEAMCGARLFDTSPFESIISGYDTVAVVHAANWGDQERYLGYCARQLSLESVLVPYTTDQLMINGHLISPKAWICPQGPVEARYAVDYHGVSPDRVIPLGMVWRRNLERLEAEGLTTGRGGARGPGRTILYAGLIAGWFPRASELLAVRALVDAVREKRLPAATVIYRPVITDDADKESLLKLFSEEPLVTLQWPQAALIGMDQSVSTSIREEVLEYLAQLRVADVFVMSATTTMMFDALHFGIPCVANFTDPTGALRKNGFSSSYVVHDESLRSVPGMPIAHSLPDLVRHVREALEAEGRAGRAAYVGRQLFSAWDYPDHDYIDRFVDLIAHLQPRR